jgi:serine/threonine protein kinase/tetratricopeptide (TPR) repeat protein
MTPDRWSQIESLFLEAVALPAEGRAALLNQACARDAALRAEVNSLLAADDPDTPLITFLLDGEVAGARIGPYRAISLLGAGGMGSVYLAVRDDDQFKKQVAIKVLKRGMDTEFMLNRFRQERQILANLEHPFIARLLDGGATADGLPYFVMEYVDGFPIKGENLSLRERLSLFRLVCEAVQYAHQNLVVHRDLKPGNILITKEGIPKLLDFGIAKLIQTDRPEAGTLTRADMRLLTPEYASPEQAMGVSITTASDIYSLGAILYELLTGRRPHRITTSSPAAIERAICHEEPEEPGLSSDLDNIILTAMRKEPQRRYASAAEFSEDIRRYLEGHPVMAHEDRWSYRTGKFIRRHKVGVLAAAALVVSLAGGIISTTVQARRAEQRFQLVRRLARGVLADAIRLSELPGSTPYRASLIQTVVQYLDSLTRDTAQDPTLDLEVADAYQLVAGIEGHPNRPNLGQPSLALSHYRKALDIYSRHVGRRETHNHALSATISALIESGDIEARTGNAAAAAENLRRISTIAAEVEARDRSELTPGTWIYISFRLGDAERRQGNSQAALVHYRKALDTAKIDKSPTASSSLRGILMRLGGAQVDSGDLWSAHANYRRALGLAEQVAARPGANVYDRSNLIGAHQSLGDLLGNPLDLNLGNRAEALVHYREALKLAEAFAAADPKDVRAQNDLADSYRSIGALLSDRGYYQKALAITEPLSSANPANVNLRRYVAIDRMGIGQAAQAIELMKSAIEDAPAEIGWLGDLSRAHAALGADQFAKGDKGEALRNYRTGLAVAERLLEKNPTAPLFQRVHADALEALGGVAPPDEASELKRKASAVWKDWIKRRIAVPYATQRLK